METLIKGLNFQSESDCYWQMFRPTQKRTGKVTWLTMQRLTGKLVRDVPNAQVWFNHAIATQPDSERYLQLKEYCEDNLANVQVFKMTGFDNYNLSYYIVGDGAKGDLVGAFVGATET